MVDSREPGNDLQDSDGSDIQPDDTDDDSSAESDEPESDVPFLLPKMQYTGISNMRTIKDVNFLGPNNEFVVSGSEDGNFFVWRRSTGSLHGIYEGDSSIVNVVEGHPHLPVVAVSGLDHTVKLFGPGYGPNKWMKTDRAEAIMARNAEVILAPDSAIESNLIDIQTRLLQNYAATSNFPEDEIRQRCNFQ